MRAVLSACCAAAALHVTQGQTLSVTSESAGTFSPYMYSMFFETEINFGGEGGLYAEMVRNRDFEALGRGNVGAADEEGPLPNEVKREEVSDALFERIVKKRKLSQADLVGLDPNEPPASTTDFRPWTTVGSADAGIVVNDAPFATNPHVLVLTALAPGGGISNPGYWGMHIRSNMTYKLSLYARLVDGTSALNVQLLCGSRVVATGPTMHPTATWAQYEATLTVAASEAPCANKEGTLNVLASAAGTVLLDHVSLFPGDAALGLFRKDLYDLLHDFAPAQMRSPGGNYMEGTGNRTRWNWQDTLGPREQRAGHYNTAWGYWVTDGLGLSELLKLSQSIGAEPLMAVFTGFTLNRQYVPLEDSGYIVDAAMALIEYLNGTASTTWGAKRVADGIADPVWPFALEVGNEEQLMGKEGYQGHYKLITDSIWAKYPSIRVVSNGLMILTGGQNRSTTCYPCIGGCGYEPARCDSWDEHTYDSFSGMAALYDVYDNYLSASVCVTQDGKRCPNVNVLEYASRTAPTLEAALAEASFLLGLERNANFVVATAYAPLFTHQSGQQWNQDLINFVSNASFALPSYYLQVMLRQHAVGESLKVAAGGVVDSTTWNASASLDNGALHVKILNYGPQPLAVDVSFGGFKSASLGTTGQVLAGTNIGEKDAANTLENPKAVVPQSVTLNVTTISPVHQQVTVPAYSFTVLTGTAEVQV
eukprot:TRINITY_DN515_c0_g1_i1.p1 TRINITY_DN515_c0_g1~~TRINITY_DN515_c0_g1_i1.p1  ORF type:complete len:707 (+),score=272.89 TRINITY_DN515_c0_g1_i1:50-2170(+)